MERYRERLAVARQALGTLDEILATHTYNESLAQTIFGRLPEYARLMHVWLDAMDAGA